MELSDLPLTPTALAGAISEFLGAAGYREVARIEGGDVPVFEDPYSIVAVAQEESVGNLVNRWLNHQGSVGTWLAGRIDGGDPKAYDIYLVLATVDRPDDEQLPSLDLLRADLSRMRKLLVTGGNVNSVADVPVALIQLGPIDVDLVPDLSSEPLAGLPRLLSAFGIDPQNAQAIVSAFENHEPMMKRLDEALQ